MSNSRYELIEDEKPNSKYEIIEEKENPPVQEAASPRSFWEIFQDFMQPKTVDQAGNPMIETLLGRLPKNAPELKPGTEENKQLGDQLVEGLAGAPGMQMVTKGIKNLSLKQIMKNIVAEKDKEKLFHTGAYNKIWDEAKNLGLDKIKLDRNYLGLKTIKKYSQSKYYDALENLIKDPTLKNAQKAQSDLGKLINSPQLNREVLTSGERSTKDAAERAQKHIKERMFRDNKGQVNQSLKDAYNQITESYGKNFKPYDNKAVKLYEKGKRTAAQALGMLKNGSFMAEKGISKHPEIHKREVAIELAKHLGIPTTVLSATGLILGGKDIMKRLLGKE